MALVANALVVLVVAIHVYIVILEMFLWRTERGMQAFGTDQAFADRSAPLAANQGLYNGFLVAGLVWGLLAADPVGFQVKVFFLACVVVAGPVRRGDGEPPHPRRAGAARGPCPGGRRGRRPTWPDAAVALSPVSGTDSIVPLEQPPRSPTVTTAMTPTESARHTVRSR